MSKETPTPPESRDKKEEKRDIGWPAREVDSDTKCSRCGSTTSEVYTEAGYCRRCAEEIHDLIAEGLEKHENWHIMNEVKKLEKKNKKDSNVEESSGVVV